jgi:hypothetical protein
MLPGLGDDRGGLHQHANYSQGRVNLDGVFGLDSPVLRHVTVDLLDAALGVLAVAAHVPFTHRAIRTGNRIGAADDTHYQIALLESARRPRVQDAAQGFMAEHQALLPGRGPAVLAVRNLDVSAANADGDGLHQH